MYMYMYMYMYIFLNGDRYFSLSLSLSLSLFQPLPKPTPVKSILPHEQFGNAVMLLEFLNTFGPLFNVKEAIRGGITIGESSSK